MRFPSLISVFILIIIGGSAYAGDVQRVKLSDGSVMKAQLISMHNGIYTFKSQSLGKFSVNAKQIQSISSSHTPTSRAGSANINLNQVQSTLKSNPKTMKLITGLKNDPDVQAVLSDPKIMNAVRRGDFKTLINNPKFQKLMNNPTIKQISGTSTSNSGRN